MSQRRSPVREQIVQVATRLMAVRGYHRTSLEDVLRESGAGKGNFYHHFRSKEELGYAILDRLVRLFTERTLEPGFEGAILMTKVEKDIGVMETCVAELRRHLAFYRREVTSAAVVGGAC